MNPCAIVNAPYNLQIIIIITGYFSVNIRVQVRVFATIVAVVVVVFETARGCLVVAVAVAARMPTGVYQVLFDMPVVVVVIVVVVAIAYVHITGTQLAVITVPKL